MEALSDSVYLNGGIRGEVVVSDADGKVLADVHNMIVLTGRQAIIGRMFSTSSPEPFSGLYLGKGTISTTSGTSYSGISADIVLSYSSMTSVSSSADISSFSVGTALAAGSTSGGSVLRYIDADGNAPEIHLCCEKACGSSEAFTISEIGLLSSTSVLFSRAIFDPVYFVANGSYRIDYHIYF
jgi:hypothetical protein